MEAPLPQRQYNNWAWLIDWMDWLIHWFSDLVIDWLADWRIDWLMDGLIDWFVDYSYWIIA